MSEMSNWIHKIIRYHWIVAPVAFLTEGGEYQINICKLCCHGFLGNSLLALKFSCLSSRLVAYQN